MKKLMIAGLTLISTFAFTSCKKDYKCVCSVNGAVIKTTQYNNISRADAEDKCDGDATFGGITYDCDVESN